MGESWRRMAVPGLMLLLAVVVVTGLATAPPPPQDRATALAEQLRCPVCQGESVADSPSDTATQIQEQIEQMVAAGRTDQEVLDHYTDRYGRWVLLDPPVRGDTLLLWVLPALALAGGAGAVVARRRRADASPGDLTDAERLELRRRAAALREREDRT